MYYRKITNAIVAPIMTMVELNTLRRLPGNGFLLGINVRPDISGCIPYKPSIVSFIHLGIGVTICVVFFLTLENNRIGLEK